MANKAKDQAPTPEANEEQPVPIDVAAAHAAKIAALDAEIREIELETARVNLAQAKQNNSKFRDSQLSREVKFKNAMRTLGQQAAQQQGFKDACAHQQGGFGMEDIYNGDGASSLAITDLPLKGRQLVICSRCLGDWQTPDPLLRQTNPELYLEQLAEWKAILVRVRNSKARVIGVPSFTFERDGVPVHPVIL